MFWRKQKDFSNPESIKDIRDDSKEIDKDYEEKVELEEKEKRPPFYIGLHNLSQIVIVLVVIGVVLTVSLLVLEELKDDVAVQTVTQTNVTTEMENNFGMLASFSSIFGIIIAAAVVLGLISLFRVGGLK